MKRTWIKLLLISAFLVSCLTILSCDIHLGASDEGGSPPKIQALYASDSVSVLNDTVTFIVDIFHPDGELAYDIDWHFQAGSAASGHHDHTFIWRAPSETGRYRIKVYSSTNAGSDSDSLFVQVIDTTTNYAPAIPSNPYPWTDSLKITLDSDLHWSCSDPDSGDVLEYDIYFGTVPEPELLASAVTDTFYVMDDLQSYTEYYWKVVARDSYGLEACSPIWHFRTEIGWFPGRPPRNASHLDTWTTYIGLNEVPLTMVYLEEDFYQMGAQYNEQDAFPDEYPRHTVGFHEGFWIGTTEVTQEQWEAIAPSKEFEFVGPDFPAEVTWEDVNNEFISWMNFVDGEYDYRLPTEAEWEYACRAGHENTRYWWGNDNEYTELGAYAWTIENSNNQTHPVAMLEPNPWGLYDIIGNVFEWCNDYYAADYYSVSPMLHPPGPETGTLRVNRGGCFNLEGVYNRTAHRSNGYPDNQLNCVGFRLVRDPQ